MMKPLTSREEPSPNDFADMHSWKSLLHILRSEWPVWVFFSISVFFIASILMTGWPSGLIPNLRFPYGYSGDSLACLMFIRRSMEGWIFNNNHQGFPFGSNLLDYPMSDTGSFLILKALGLIFKTPQAAMNLYFLIGFPVTFVCSYVCLRTLDVLCPFSVAASLLFVFLPFHFQRVPHLFYTWYFVVPIFFYFGFRLFSSKLFGLWKETARSQALLDALVLFSLASFGAYYAFFGCLLLSISSVSGAMRNKTYSNFVLGFVASCIVSFGVFINIAPNIYHRMTAGRNLEFGHDAPSDSETCGLKLVQMLLPRQNHRIGRLSRITERYSKTFPLVNENATSALGFIGALGFISLLCVAIALMSGLHVDDRLVFFSVVNIFLFFFATVGGFSALFALLVTPLLRGWNRISVFIGFGAIAGIFLALQISLEKFFLEAQVKKLIWPIAVGILIAGFLDQTVPAPLSDNNAIRAEFESDHLFIRKIETLVPPKSAIYQLPYMPFPEVPPIHQLMDYGLSRGFIQSHSLRWNYGGMKGRDGDMFFRLLSQQPLVKQLKVVKRLGFRGVYIDRRGYEDHGKEIETNLANLLGISPSVVSKDNQLSFFLIPTTSYGDSSLQKLNPVQVMSHVGFISPPYGLQFSVTDGSNYPHQVGQVKNNEIITNGQPGCLLFGPYVPMRAGRYLLQVFGSVLDADGVVIDVASRNGTNEIAKFNAIALVAHPGIILDQELKLNRDVERLEVRVFVSEKSRLSVRGYKLVPRN